MDVHVIVYLLLLSKQMTAVIINGTTAGSLIAHHFMANVVEKSSSTLVSIGVVLSPHWVLAPAHPFPDDSKGVACENYLIIAGETFRTFHPSYALTHPAYTWGLYTPEDFILFYITRRMNARPVLISAGRFPWNVIDCDYIYCSDDKSSLITEGLLNSFKIEVTVMQNCLIQKQRKPTGLLQFYINDLLCGRAGRERPKTCVGKTGGVLFCGQLFVGFMIRKDWCHDKTANFTDVGSYTNWLQSRVSIGQFIRLQVAQDSATLSSYRISFIFILAYLLLKFFH